MMNTPKVGQWVLNKYGILEEYQGYVRSRRRLELIHDKDRIWKAVNHGYLQLGESTTHVRFTIEEVELHGLWQISMASYLFEIGPDLAGQRFDFVLAAPSGCTVLTNLSGMHRKGAAPLYVQELILSEGEEDGHEQ